MGIKQNPRYSKLQKVFAKSELIPSINPSRTQISSIKNFNLHPQERQQKR